LCDFVGTLQPEPGFANAQVFTRQPNCGVLGVVALIQESAVQTIQVANQVILAVEIDAGMAA